ncbi:MAG: insulinase family protein, partial [Sumerlaeia bacterium]
MNKLAFLYSLLALLLITSCSSKNTGATLQPAPIVQGATLVTAPTSTDLLQVYEYQLENGLQVYLMPNAESPRFYAEIAVRTGSRNDPAETTGLAHYLEHLLFKGTDQIGTTNFAAEKPHLDRITELYEEHFREDDPARREALYAQIDAEAQLAARYAIPNEFQQIYQVLGGDALNAHTWVDETVYKIDLPSNRIRQWAALESERFRKPIFRGFHTELQIVYEEKNRALDNKDRILYEALHRTLYLVHPYGQQTTLGTAEHLRRPSLVTIQNYYDTYYVPNNMAVIISGDIDINETMTSIIQYFGAFQAKPLPAEPTWDEPELNTVRRVEVNYPGEEQVAIAFRTAPAKSEDRFALELLDMILDNKTAGLINLNINLQQKAQSAGAYPQINNDFGSQTLWGIAKEDQTLEQVEALLLEQLTLIKNGNFEDDLIPSIVNDFRKSRQLELESNIARVERLRDVYLNKRSWAEARNDLDRYKTITKQDIIAVANRYFSSGYVVAYRRDAEYKYEAIEPPKITQLTIEAGRESPFAKSIQAMPTNQIEPQYVDFKTDVARNVESEARTYYQAVNPVNQLFTLSIVVEKGTNHDPRLSLLASLMNKAGTESLNSEAFKKALYRLGTDFSYAAADNQTVVTISGLDDEFEASLQLLQNFLTAPQPEAETLTTLVQRILTQRSDSQKDAPSVSRAASWYSRYGDNSPFREELSNTELSAISEADLLALHQDLFRHKQLVAYVGPRSLRAVQTVV